MRNKDKLLLVIIAVIILIVFTAVSIFSQPNDNSGLSISNETNQSTENQESGSQSSGNLGSDGISGTTTTNPDDKSTQYKKCPTCHGTGFITKTVDKRVACPKTISMPVYDLAKHKIIGYRDVTCPTCDGTGFKTVKVTVKEKCSTCGGSGKIAQ